MNTETLSAMMDGATLVNAASLGVQQGDKPAPLPLKTDARNKTDITLAIAAMSAGIPEEEVWRGLEAARTAAHAASLPAAIRDAASGLHEAGATLTPPRSPAAPTTGKAQDNGQKQR